MAKDWEYWKQTFLKSVINQFKETFVHFEKTIESPIERIAWLYITENFDFLWKTGRMNLKRQMQIANYFADIYIEYYSSREEWIKIVIECDGHDFHEKTKEQAARDKRRDREMTLSGYKVLRYTGSEIVSDPEQIISDIYDIMVSADGV